MRPPDMAFQTRAVRRAHRSVSRAPSAIICQSTLLRPQSGSRPACPSVEFPNGIEHNPVFGLVAVVDLKIPIIRDLRCNSVILHDLFVRDRDVLGVVALPYARQACLQVGLDSNESNGILLGQCRIERAKAVARAKALNHHPIVLLKERVDSRFDVPPAILSWFKGEPDWFDVQETNIRIGVDQRADMRFAGAFRADENLQKLLHRSAFGTT